MQPAVYETGVARKRVAGGERRAQLIEAALRLFSERGYDATATRDIAETVGVAEGLLFRHFASKLDLLRAVLDTYGPRSHAQRLAPQVEPLPVQEALELIYLTRVDQLWENRQFVRLVLTESKKPGEAAHEFKQMIEEAPQFTAEFLRGRIARGELRDLDPEVGAAMLGGAVFSFFMRHWQQPAEVGQTRCRTFVKECVALFLRGALPRP